MQSTTNLELDAFAPADRAYLQKHQKLILAAGGTIVNEIFVTQPGVLPIAHTQVMAQAASLFNDCHLDPQASPIEQLVEFNARLTYLSFPNEPQDSLPFHNKMARDLGHLSIWGGIHITFLLAGISVETSMELIAHSEAKVARLTTSKTKAMNLPLFRLQGSVNEQTIQKQYLSQLLMDQAKAFQNLRTDVGSMHELINRLAPGAKATSLTYTMSVKDFHKLFIGRLSEHGNEIEVQEVCQKMCKELHQQYPVIIRSPEEYYQLNNAAKYH